VTAIVSPQRRASHQSQRADLHEAQAQLDLVLDQLGPRADRDVRAALRRALALVANTLRLLDTEPNASAFQDERVQDPGRFDPRSFRTITHDDGTQVTVGCPVGHWHPRAPAGAQCGVPMEVQRIRHPKGATANPPLLAILNPSRGEQLGDALYEVTYQHVRDPVTSPPRRHVFDHPQGVGLWILNEYQVLLQAHGQELVGWFDAHGRRRR
jgi:hypothetical protein